MKIIPSFKPSINFREIADLVVGGFYGNAGSEREEFKLAFSRYAGAALSIDAASARWGLYFLLKGLKLNEGDEIILPAFNYLRFRRRLSRPD